MGSLKVWYCLVCGKPVRGDVPCTCRCKHPVVPLRPTIVWLAPNDPGPSAS